MWPSARHSKHTRHCRLIQMLYWSWRSPLRVSRWLRGNRRNASRVSAASRATAGAPAIRNEYRFQEYFQNVPTMTQHAFTSASRYESVGALMLDVESGYQIVGTAEARISPSRLMSGIPKDRAVAAMMRSGISGISPRNTRPTANATSRVSLPHVTPRFPSEAQYRAGSGHPRAGVLSHTNR